MCLLVQDMTNAGYPIYFSFFGYCVTVTATIHILYMNDSSPDVSQQAATCLNLEVSYLEQFSRLWKTGKNMVCYHSVTTDISRIDVSKLEILYRLTARRKTCDNLANLSPRSLEDTNAEDIEALWAAVDYSTMSEESVVGSPSTMSASMISDWSSAFSLQKSQIAENHSFNTVPHIQALNSSTSQVAFDPDMYNNMSSFFGTSPMNMQLNFGG